MRYSSSHNSFGGPQQPSNTTMGHSERVGEISLARDHIDPSCSVEVTQLKLSQNPLIWSCKMKPTPLMLKLTLFLSAVAFLASSWAQAGPYTKYRELLIVVMQEQTRRMAMSIGFNEVTGYRFNPSAGVRFISFEGDRTYNINPGSRLRKYGELVDLTINGKRYADVTLRGIDHLSNTHYTEDNRLNKRVKVVPSVWETDGALLSRSYDETILIDQFPEYRIQVGTRLNDALRDDKNYFEAMSRMYFSEPLVIQSISANTYAKWIRAEYEHLLTTLTPKDIAEMKVSEKDAMSTLLGRWVLDGYNKEINLTAEQSLKRTILKNHDPLFSEIKNLVNMPSFRNYGFQGEAEQDAEALRFILELKSVGAESVFEDALKKVDLEYKDRFVKLLKAEEKTEKQEKSGKEKKSVKDTIRKRVTQVNQSKSRTDGKKRETTRRGLK